MLHSIQFSVAVSINEMLRARANYGLAAHACGARGPTTLSQVEQRQLRSRP